MQEIKWIYGPVFLLFYLVIEIFLCLRSKSVEITRRSPWLLHISNWGNLLESLSIFVIYNSLTIETFPGINLATSGVVLGHFVLFLPYILRSYRLYIVFFLEKD